MSKQKTNFVEWLGILGRIFFVCIFLLTSHIGLIGKENSVKVYIMIGQSNMIGFGRINTDTVKGTLSYLTLKEGKYQHLPDNSGNWAERNDVWYVQTTVGHRQHWLAPIDEYRHIGPELQFGHVVGDYHDEIVLIIKASQGNRSLGWDILPPGSESFVYDGMTYAGYRDSTPSWIEGQPKKSVNWYAVMS